MFIGIFSKVSRERGEHSMVYFAADNVVKIMANVDGGALFTFAEGEMVTYETPSYDAAGLVELVMQARLRPNEFLPSLYVGKKESVTSTSFAAPGYGKDDE